MYVSPKYWKNIVRNYTMFAPIDKLHATLCDSIIIYPRMTIHVYAQKLMKA